MAITIPEFITVHLGAPSSNAQNVRVPFIDYIKNVASSEIYPTWPENAIRANIYAQITYALNRIFTEYYRSRGYDFDITNNTAYDQFFVPNRNIFDRISDIVDEIFNSYIQRQGTVGPIFSAYCNGTTVTCDGLSQWGTVPLANRGLVPYEILQNYYGDDIDIISDVDTSPFLPSYDGTPSKKGDKNEEVRAIQSRLNTVANNYPAIPKISPVDGDFGEETERAVKAFQRIFSLTPDGVVGKGTWYKLVSLSSAVLRLSELNSKGLTLEQFNQQFPGALRLGDSGLGVEYVQYLLSAISWYYSQVPAVTIDGEFGESTRQSVIAFQKAFSLDPDGIIGETAWQELVRVFLAIEPYFKQAIRENKINPGQFSGVNLRNEG